MLLGEDSPYMQESILQSKEQAAGRGLLNTSMAAGAGRRAAIQSALPIATADARTYAGFLERGQAADIAASQTGVESGYRVDEAFVGEGISSRLSEQSWEQSLGTLDKQHAQRLVEADKEFGFTQSIMANQQAFDEKMANLGYTEARRILFSNVYSSISKQYLASMTDLYAAEDIDPAEALQNTTDFNNMTNNFAIMLGFPDMNFSVAGA